MRKVPDNVKALRGTTMPCRTRKQIVAFLEGEAQKPEHLRQDEALIWDEVVADCEARGTPLRGTERQLWLYVSLLADIKRKLSAGVEVTQSAYTNASKLGSKFYEDPESQRAKAGGPAAATGNPFVDDRPPK